MVPPWVFKARDVQKGFATACLSVMTWAHSVLRLAMEEGLWLGGSASAGQAEDPGLSPQQLWPKGTGRSNTRAQDPGKGLPASVGNTDSGGPKLWLSRRLSGRPVWASHSLPGPTVGPHAP